VKARKIMWQIEDALELLGAEARSALTALFAPLIAGVRMARTGIRLIWGREEQAAAGYHGIAMCLIAGVIMAVAKPIAFWVTGWGSMQFDATNNVYFLDKDGDSVYDPNEPAVPADLVNMIGRVFDIVFYIGVVLLVIGLIIAGIRLVWRKRKN